MFASAPATLLLRLISLSASLGLNSSSKTTTQAAFRSDFRDHTLVFTKDPRAGHTIGFEVRDIEALERAADALAQNGYEITAGSPEEAARRKVKTFLSFNAKRRHGRSRRAPAAFGLALFPVPRRRRHRARGGRTSIHLGRKGRSPLDEGAFGKGQ